MERESNPMEALCRSGCGFYGNPSTDGLCSVCFKRVEFQEALKKKQQPPATTPSPVASTFVPTPATPLAAAAPTVPTLPAQTQTLTDKLEEESAAGTSGASTGASDTDADDKDPSKDKKKKNRCAVCRKKVGLTGFECRCGGLFCAVHRYSDKHDCSFDYRELGAQEIRRNNPVVVSQKIHKI
ncbi:AN1-type zinc finger protein 6 isoform X1 [Zerene cesonia]|uniref:AN1-type zinc finger protein 6 isoform X1 n=1 Tax=Zerene cesonia TaxID=33412 RepID=UPI0018E58617|nr:AN1-type zinc finger protein 6 isoform X1 [Zerene cesonia]XP_038221678.1 AN1-type zinc finger protein 6 isoform X1 [Zerene cesonia]XP_038221679.1 AN1-type zinc finger protein 6 isoform X1 [Zerene cesonia]XP_038221680.1 AN1-type zinc finger protein 6 isoform X1 [Zerene cesonia]XP_038221681.1 AN1-type zinc finger protein 6 isoform X1 [Zerene cesonia]XP_038221682.1 AN1-type zinc finger protein 6 isoform X1 [Zerene cesonia]XP_038221683.1 AN1-type zinc finger protein 6 isoform X1 [Zerene cesoni